jgi:hypothetical protein
MLLEYPSVEGTASTVIHLQAWVHRAPAFDALLMFSALSQADHDTSQLVAP